MRQVARPRFSTLSAGHTCSRPQKAADDIQRLVEMVKKRQYDPLIVFSFSKKECEAHATATHTLDINTGAERVPAERACPGTCNMECELHLHNVQETPKVHTHTHTHTHSLSLSLSLHCRRQTRRRRTLRRSSAPPSTASATTTSACRR